MSQLLNQIKRVNRENGLGLGSKEVQRVGRVLNSQGLVGNERYLSASIVRVAKTVTSVETKEESKVKTADSVTGPRMVGRGPAVAHGYSCPRCNNGRLLSLNIATAKAQLPFCPTCRIAVVPAGDM